MGNQNVICYNLFLVILFPSINFNRCGFQHILRTTIVSWKAKTNDPSWTRFKQRIRSFSECFFYGLIGIFAAAIDFGIFYILTVPLGLNKFISNIISMHIGMLVSFSLNATVNFKKTDRIFYRFIRYYLIILFGMGLSSAILWAGGFIISSNIILKAIAIMIVAGVQFVLNSTLTFRRWLAFFHCRGNLVNLFLIKYN